MLKLSFFHPNLTILVVGNTDQFLSAKPKLPACSDTLFCVISDLTPAFLEKHKPNVVLSPLVTSQHDILELAIVLDRLNFEGQFRVLVAPLPNPEVILSEVRFECPALDFDLITVQTDPDLKSV